MTGPIDSHVDKFISLLANRIITQKAWRPTFRQANRSCKNVNAYTFKDKPEWISNISIREPFSNTRGNCRTLSLCTKS